MSCVAAISVRLSPEDLARANAQRFKYSSPAPRPSLLERIVTLSQSPNPKIRESAAAAYNIPDRVAKALTYDKEPGVRRALARNDRVPRAVAIALSYDEDELVRGFCVLNPVAPPMVVYALMNDRSELVRYLADYRAILDEERAGG